MHVRFQASSRLSIDMPEAGGYQEGNSTDESEDTVVTAGKKPPISYAETLMHMVKAYLGTEMFALGSVYKNTGYAVGTLFIVATAVMSVYCQHLLIFCIQKVEALEETPTSCEYGETAKLSCMIGPRTIPKLAVHMRNLVNVFLIIYEIGVCCNCLIFIGQSLEQIYLSWGWKVNENIHMVYVTLIVLWPLALFFRNLKILAPLSCGANIVILISCIMIYFVTGSEMSPMDLDVKVVAPPSLYELETSTVLFAFASINCIPTLRNEMKSPDQLKGTLGVLNLSALLVFSVYTSMGLMTYLCYGDDVEKNVFTNFPNKGSLGLVCVIAQFLMVLVTCISFTIHMYVICEVVCPWYHNRLGPIKQEIFERWILRTTLMLLVFFIAIAIPFLDFFIPILGAITGSVLMFLMTPLMHFLIAQCQLQYIVLNVISLVFGVFMGTAVTFYENYKEIRESIIQ